MTNDAPKKRTGNPEALAEYRRKVAAGEIVPGPRKTKVVPRDRYGRPRDSQKSKVYRAEICPEDPALKVNRTRSTWYHNSYPDIDVAQAWVDDLTSQRWFQSRWGRIRIPVVAGNGCNASYHGRVMLSSSGRMEAGTVLHEVAHWLASRPSVQAHGPEFAATLVVLVEGRFGKEAGRRIRESFVKHGVRYRSGMKAVPKPGTHAVVGKNERAAREKAAKEARTRQLVGSIEKRGLAAEVIRAAVTAGEFGPSGSTGRTRALAVARQLEKTAVRTPVKVAAGGKRK